MVDGHTNPTPYQIDPVSEDDLMDIKQMIKDIEAYVDVRNKKNHMNQHLLL